ncbi:MAG TPA: alpha/beta hydrolase [Chloroflexia bacterium]|nr:alpha/beta hydrolase [Chloroflexia bacterium]
MPKTGQFVASTTLILGTALYLHYSAYMRDLKARLRAGSRIAQTTFGPIEYASIGDGPAVLILHGIGGGYDQGLLVTRLNKENPFKLISISRPGYLRTPLRTGATPEEQADAYAALLDTLRIDRVAVVGISAGGPSALQFALRHPNRCWALISVSGVSQRIVSQLNRFQSLVAALLDSDFTLWLLGAAARGILFSLSGVSPAVRKELEHDPAKMEVLTSILRPLPISRRKIGFQNDLEQFAGLSTYELEHITAPTMVLHGTDDRVVPLRHGEFVANSIPHAELVTIEGGGHLCVVTHKEEALPALMGFLKRHAP